VEGKGQDEPEGVDLPEHGADILERGLGGQDDNEDGQAEGELEGQRQDPLRFGHFRQRHFAINRLDYEREASPFL